MFANNFGHRRNVLCGLVGIFQAPQRNAPIARATTGPVPLKSVSIVANLIHAVAEVEVTQVYVNKEKNPIEAIYYFPTHPKGAVTSFQAIIDGVTITGIVKPEEEAKEEYAKAIREETTACLGEENMPDIFKVSVGFLKPQAEARIIIKYTTEVKNEEMTNAIRFYIPTTIAPRYIPPTETDPKGLDLQNMTFAASTPAPLTIKVNVAMQGDIREISCLTHAINCTFHPSTGINSQWKHATVDLVGQTTDMDKDFVLLISPAEVHQPRIYSEKLGESSTAMLHFIPQFKMDEQKAELIFLLDRSGSMTGPSILKAKEALNMFLHAAPADCYFNVIGFGSSFKSLFDQSQKYSDKTLERAERYTQHIHADLGGTEILKPLSAIFKKPAIEGYLRQIFVLTDGEVSNTEQVIGLVKANSHRSRVFSLGIGAACCHHLVEGLAKAGGGTSHFVTYNESIDTKVLQQLQNALQPALTNIQLKWEGITNNDMERSRIAPRLIPPVYAGSQLLLFGTFPKLPTAVTLTAFTPSGKLSETLALNPEDEIGSNGILHKLAGVKIVRELEMEHTYIEYGGVANSKERMADIKKDIVDIACKNNIASKFTSFIAVDEKSKTTNDKWVMQTRNVPSQIADGWHGTGGASMPSGASGRRRGSKGSGASCRRRRSQSSSAQGRRRCSKSSSAQSRRRRSKASSASSRRRRSNASRSSSCGRRTGTSSAASRRPWRNTSTSGRRRKSPVRRRGAQTARTLRGGRKPAAGAQAAKTAKSARSTRSVSSSRPTSTANGNKDALVRNLVAMQSAQGAFSLNQKFANAISQNLDALKKEATKNKWDEKVWATVLALAYFSEKLKEHKQLWELFYKKSQKWLNGLKDTKKDVGNMTAAAKKILS